MFNDSSRFYTQRRRGRGARQQLSYQQYLAGEVDEIVAAEVASSQSPIARSIMIGVVTGALTLVVNRWLERWLK